jgi:hypothetical protein
MDCPRCDAPGYDPPATNDALITPCGKCGFPDSDIDHLKIGHLATRAALVRDQGWAQLTDPELYLMVLAWVQAEDSHRLTRSTQTLVKATLLLVVATLVAAVIVITLGE